MRVFICTLETRSTFLSASNKQIIDTIPQRLRKQIKESKYATLLTDITYASAMLEYAPERGNVSNNEYLANKTIQTISNIYGNASAIPLFGVIPDGRGDDLAYFQEKVPGVYFLLGGSNFEKGIIAMPHAPNFAVDETCIKKGAAYFSSMILEQIND